MHKIYHFSILSVQFGGIQYICVVSNHHHYLWKFFSPKLKLCTLKQELSISYCNPWLALTITILLCFYKFCCPGYLNRKNPHNSFTLKLLPNSQHFWYQKHGGFSPTKQFSTIPAEYPTIWVDLFLLSQSSLYILHIISLSAILFVNISSNSVGCLFLFLLSNFFFLFDNVL